MQASEKYDVCIVGAGIAGSALAVLLGSRGWSVALIERKWYSVEGITGELLQPGGVQMLQEMDLMDVLSDIEAQRIEGYAMYLQGQWLEMSYPTTNRQSCGYGFRYHELVQKLRTRASELTAVDVLDGQVVDVLWEDRDVAGVIYHNTTADRQSTRVEADLTILCQGYPRAFSKAFNKGTIHSEGHMLGLLLENATLPFEHHGHVILADPSPVLVYPVGEGQTRVLIDFPKDLQLRGTDLRQYLLDTLRPQLPEVLQEPFAVAVHNGQYQGRGTYRLTSRPAITSGLVVVGDNLNMRHPITGGGMTVALTDVKLLSDMLAPGPTLADTRGIAKRFYQKRHELDATINILADALYRVFKHRQLRLACFDYLSQGGDKLSKPVSLLAATNRSRRVLIQHFAGVAWHGARHFKRIKEATMTPGGPVRLLWDAGHIIWPLIWTERPRFYPAAGQNTMSDNNRYENEKRKTRKEPQRASA